MGERRYGVWRCRARTWETDEQGRRREFNSFVLANECARALRREAGTFLGYEPREILESGGSVGADGMYTAGESLDPKAAAEHACDPPYPTMPSAWWRRVENLFAGFAQSDLIAPAERKIEVLPPSVAGVARALFATDERIESLVALRAEREEDRRRVLKVAWERDEFGVRTESMARAEKMFAYEREVFDLKSLPVGKEKP